MKNFIIHGVMEHKEKVNIIIHGVMEHKEKAKEKDEEFVNDLLAAIGVDFKPESIVRPGKSDHNRTRPIKMKLRTENEMDSIVARLSNLKNALKRINITEDYTFKERQEIKQWVGKAKEKKPSGKWQRYLESKRKSKKRTSLVEIHQADKSGNLIYDTNASEVSSKCIFE